MGLVTGVKTLDGSSQQLTGTRYSADAVVIKAHPDNAEVCYFGAEGATSANGFVLAPGEEFSVDNEQGLGHAKYNLQPHEIYVDGAVGDRVCLLAWIE